MTTQDIRSRDRLHRDRQIKEVEHDPYAERYKPPGNSFCPDCGVVYARGRWVWGERPSDAVAHACPACRRIRDNFPAGHLTLRGEYMTQHLEELRALIRHQETLAKAEHPLQRIIGIDAQGGVLKVTTTDTHLVQRLGNALHGAHKGTLQINHSPDEYLVRVDWER